MGQPAKLIPVWARLALAGGVAAAMALFGLLPAPDPATAAVASRWVIMSSPNRGPNLNILSGVSCFSANACKAVGESFAANSVGRTLIESWNGKIWTIDPSPNNGTSGNALSAVSCISATSCVAVGVYISPRAVQNLVEFWDGRTWSVVPSPDEGRQENALYGVSCSTARSCVAVGHYLGSSAFRTLVESWNGVTWTIVPSPNVGLDDVLDAVSCPSATWCTAGGSSVGPPGTEKTLIESWNGARWSVVPSPNLGTYDNFVDVACASARFCQAVGFFAKGHVFQTLTEAWNGARWSITPSPDTGSYDNVLYGVSCPATDSCEAVGRWSETSRSAPRTLVEAWNGRTWSITPSPNHGPAENELEAVACTLVTSCRAVGVYYYSITVDAGGTLVESYG
jgi:hypothetical protein